MHIPDDAIVRIIDRRTGQPLAGNRGRPMTYKGFLGHLRGYRQRGGRFGDTPGGKYSHPDNWVLEVFEKTSEVAVSGIKVPEHKIPKWKQEKLNAKGQKKT